MKEIFILRHAKSSWSNLNLSDFDRPLAKRGINDAKKLSFFLENNSFKVDQVICSKAKRAKETFDLVASGFKFSIEKAIYLDDLYFGGIKDVFNKIKDLDDSLESVLVVGHNPTLHLMVENLTDTYIKKFSTCNLAVLSYKDSWNNLTSGKCKLKSLYKPKEIKI